MTKRAGISGLVVLGAAIAVLAWTLGGLGSRVLSPRRPKPRMPTITTLPKFPRIPTSGVGLSRQERDQAIQTLVNHKVSTYPAASSRGHRAGKFTSTGLFGGFPPTEDQIARLAPHWAISPKYCPARIRGHSFRPSSAPQGCSWLRPLDRNAA